MKTKESYLNEQEELLRGTLMRYKIAKELRKRKIGKKQDNRIIEDYVS